MHVSMLQHYIGDKRIICTLSFFCKHSYSGALISAQCKLEQAFFYFIFFSRTAFSKRLLEAPNISSSSQDLVGLVCQEPIHSLHKGLG